MMKWYSVEIAYYSRETINRADNFKMWLYDHDIKHETSIISGHPQFVHFEIYASPEDLDILQSALDKIVFFDAITAQ